MKHFTSINQLFVIIATLIIYQLLSLPTQADSPLVLTDEQDRYILDTHVYILEDSSAALTFDQIKSSAYVERFRHFDQSRERLAGGDISYWIRIELINQTRQTNDWWLLINQGLIDQVNFYDPSQTTSEITQAGVLIPFTDWATDFWLPTFRLMMQPAQQQTFYLRVENETSFALPLEILSTTAFFRFQRNEELLQFIPFAILLIMAVYNLFLYFFLRDINYLYYTLFVFFLALGRVAGRGVAYQYFWPDYTGFNTVAFLLFLNLMIAFFIRFTSIFLNIRTLLPKVYWFLTGIAGLLALNALLLAIVGRLPKFLTIIGSILNLITLTVIVVIALLIWYRGYRPARYYLLGFGIVLLVGLLGSTQTLGLLPNVLNNPAILNVLAISSVVSLAVLFSLALADRINVIKQENTDAQTALLNQQAEALRLQDQFNSTLQQTNLELEQRVSSRTAELAQAKQIAEEARVKAEDANQAKSAFLANMSHELRTPLNSILGYAQVLHRDPALTTRQLEGVGIIQQSGEHLLTLINDVLDLARVEAGRLELYTTQFHLKSFLEGVVGIIEMRAHQKNLSLTFEETTPLLIGVTADETRLRQVLINLLGNAVKFTHQGGIVFRVSILDEPAPTINQVASNKQIRIRFEIEDTGVGMADEALEKIFLPFEQVGDHQTRAESTGLGLAISRQLVEAMGGTLQVKSWPGQGSTFWFELDFPTVQLETLQPTPLEQIKGYTTALDNGVIRVLITDDKYYNRAVIRGLLEPLGFVIAEAEDGQQCILQVQQFEPHLILMDLVMPVMTGFEATQVIRQMSFVHDIVIIAISASVLEKEKVASLSAGCNAFLSKPIQAEALFETIAIHLDLEWIYDHYDDEILITSISKIEVESADFVSPPQKEIALLYNLTLKGRLPDIRKEATRIAQMEKTFEPFAEELDRLAKDFDEEGLKAFLEQCMNKR